MGVYYKTAEHYCTRCAVILTYIALYYVIELTIILALVFQRGGGVLVFDFAGDLFRFYYRPAGHQRRDGFDDFGALRKDDQRFGPA
mgnify:CR=1 FL=1